MSLLAFETATERMSLALECNGHVWVEEMGNDARHSKVLLPMIEKLLADAKTDFSDLEGLVVGTGPGGFTSLRIGLAVAQGLSLAHQIPIYPVSSLLNVAAACQSARQALVVMDARMGEVYTQLFERAELNQDQSLLWAPISDATVVAPEEVGLPKEHSNLMVVGNGLMAHEATFRKTLWREGVVWDPSLMPSASRALGLRGAAVQAWGLQPNYVRNNITH